MTRKTLRERDGDDCHICQEPMVFKNGIHPDFASIDHVHPRGKGGRNNMDNLKLAHRRCNEAKGDAAL